MKILYFYAPDIGVFSLTDELLQTEQYSLPEDSTEITEPPEGEWLWDPDTEEWVENPEALTQWREVASLKRRDFVKAAVYAGILPKEQAAQAARGDWPSAFNSALEEMPDDDARLDAEIDWATADNVTRNGLLLSAVQDAASVSDEQLDEMFGWNS